MEIKKDVDVLIKEVAACNALTTEEDFALTKAVQDKGTDCEEMKNRWIEFREKERPDSFERNRYNHDICEQEMMLNAYNHCLRIITGEQKLMEERMF